VRPGDPPLLFRLSVVAAGVALVLGLVSGALIVLGGNGEESARGPGLLPRVRVAGAPAGSHLRLEVTWMEGGRNLTARATPLPGVEGVWLVVPPVPEAVEVRVEVFDDSGKAPRRLAVRRLALAAGREEVVMVGDVRSPAPRPPASSATGER
jgi:hypothetical protein